MDFRQLLEQLKNIEEARMGVRELSASPKSELTFGFEVEVNYIPEFDEDSAKEEARIEAENNDDMYVSEYEIFEFYTDNNKFMDLVDDYLVPLYGFARLEDVVRQNEKDYADTLKDFFKEADKAVEDDAEMIMNRYRHIFDDEYSKTISLKDKTDMEKLQEYINLVKKNYIYDENKDYGDEINKEWVYDDEDQTDITYIPNISYNDLEDYFEDIRALKEYLSEEANEKRQEKIDEYIESRVEEMRETYMEDEEHFTYAAEIFENDFSTAFNIDTKYGYHDGSKDTDNYTIEPDSSIGTGIEIVSPVFDNYEEFMSELENVLDWITERDDFVTTDRTGIHINIGMKDMSEKIDILKLLLFMGETNIAKEFGRLYNTYAVQTLDLVKDIMDEKPSSNYKDSIEVINLELLRRGDKYRTVNFRRLHDNDYIEFRGMGGENYHRKWNKIKSNIGRFVRIIEISMDENAYRKDYLKKLTKLLQGVDPRALMKMHSDYYKNDFPVGLISSIRSFFSNYYSPRQMSAFGDSYYINKYAFIDRIVNNATAIEALSDAKIRLMVRNFVSEIEKHSTDNTSNVEFYKNEIEGNLEKLPNYPNQVKFLKSLL
jgi:hypothetical protein